MRPKVSGSRSLRSLTLGIFGRQVTYKMPLGTKSMICPREQIGFLGGMEKFEKLCIMCSQAFENDMQPVTIFFGNRLGFGGERTGSDCVRRMRPVTQDLLETLIFAPY